MPPKLVDELRAHRRAAHAATGGSVPPGLSEDNPFWDFSLEVYARPGLSEACLALQEEFGVDVNMLLFCMWLAQQGRALDDAAAGGCMAIAGPWQNGMVTPLRALRHACRDDTSLAPEGLRESLRQELLRVELHAERIEQELLLDFSTAAFTSGSAAAPRSPATAERNIATYFAAAGIVMNARTGELIERILPAIA